MSILDIQEQITGGESIYCINEAQMRRTQQIIEDDGESGEKVRKAIDHLESNLSRNERAALAFTLIERLNKI